MRHIKLVAILALTVLGWATGWAAAEIVSFQERRDNAFVTNYQGTDDAVIYRDRADSNIGNYAIAPIGRLPWSPNGPGRGLLRFDLSAMAGQYADINSLTLNIYDEPQGASITFNVYAIAAANAGWVEGTKNGNQGAAAGENTWNSRNHGANSWAGSAGLSTPGTDYDPVSLGSFATSAGYKAVSIPLTGHAGLTLKDLIDQWSGDQASNPGLLIMTDYAGGSNAYDWVVSTEAINIWGASYDTPPELVIDYVIPEPATLALLGLGAVALVGRRRTVLS